MTRAFPINYSAKPVMIAPGRIQSLDSYRGFAIFSMILVNYLGMFDSMPWHFRHHAVGMSFADIVAPLFIFVAGMGFRHSFQKRTAAASRFSASAQAVRRYALLIVIGIVLYGPSLDNWRYWWDALVDIGFSGILALPFIGRSITVRACGAIFYVGVYQLLYTATGYGDWTMANSIDGGPLGTLSWACILLFGTVAFDIIAVRNNKRIIIHCLLWGLVLCMVGWLLKIEWPGLKTEWAFSQRGMSAPYPLYAAGLCFLLYLPFYFVCDIKGWSIPHLSVLGLNPLVLYLMHMMLIDIHGTFIVSQEAGILAASFGFITFYIVCYAVGWKLHHDGIIIKV